MDLLPHPAVLRCGSRLVSARDRMRHPYGYERSGMLAYPHRRIMTQRSHCCVLDLLRPCLSLLVLTLQPCRQHSRQRKAASSN